MTSSHLSSSGIRWRILALLVFASFVAHALRSNLSIAGERMIGELGLTKLQLGDILAAFASPTVVIASLMLLRFLMGVLPAPLVVFGAAATRPLIYHVLVATALVLGLANGAVAQDTRTPRTAARRIDSVRVPQLDHRIDVVTPMAPELATFGAYPIGVRTITVTDRNRRDVLRMTAADTTARYDRSLTLEVWYPAAAESPARVGEYRVIMRDPSVTISLFGQAQRDATPRDGDAPFPLLIISHGYPGNRYLLSHLSENLASKGYVVVSIDHTESTYDNAQAFASTLYNRSLDQLFVLQSIAELGAPTSRSFLAGRVDASRSGLIGYSMGGYGVVNTIGGGFRTAAATLPGAPPNNLLLERSADNPTYQDRKFNRARSSIRRTYGAIADPARAGRRAAACPPPRLGGRPDGVARGRPVAAGRGDRSDAPVGRTRAPNVPARRRGVGVRLSGPDGPRRVVAWRPVQTVLGSRADSARQRGPPSRRGG